MILANANRKRVIGSGIALTNVTMTSSGFTTAIEACNSLVTTTRYKTGNGLFQVGDTIYEDAQGTILLNGGDNFYSDVITNFRISSIGKVTSVGSCVI